MKRILLLSAAAVLLLTMLLVACTAQEKPPVESDTTSLATEAATTAEPEVPTNRPITEAPTAAVTEPEPEPEPEPTELSIDAENPGRILVAYYKENAPASDSIYHSADNFCKIIKDQTGLSVKLTRVRQTSDNQSVTFLIGDTPYEETERVRASLPENSYAVQIIGRKIVIIGSNEILTVKALKDFCDRVLSHAAEGSLTVRPEDCFTITLDQPYTIADMVADGLTVTADYAEILHAPTQGQYSISQGAASDGTYVYIALRNSDDTGAVIVKYRLDDGSFVAKSPVLQLGHANDMTYNTAKNILVVAHGQKQGKILTLVNPETLEFMEDVNIEKGAGAITYNPATNAYAISQGGKSLHMLDKDLGYVTSYERTKLDGYTAQGMGSDEGYIYFPMSGSGQNILDTFDWEGNRITQIILPTPHESESLFYVNGRHFVSFNHNGGTVYEIFFRAILPHTQP